MDKIRTFYKPTNAISPIHIFGINKNNNIKKIAAF